MHYDDVVGIISGVDVGIVAGDGGAVVVCDCGCCGCVVVRVYVAVTSFNVDVVDVDVGDVGVLGGVPCVIGDVDYDIAVVVAVVGCAVWCCLCYCC